MKRLLVVSILVICGNVLFSQEERFLDYIVTEKHDTIFGTIRQGVFNNYLWERNHYPESDGVKFYSRTLKNIVAYRYNDCVNIITKKGTEDGIYQTPGDLPKKQPGAPQLPDYIVTAINDTVYGNISGRLFGNPQLRAKDGKKTKVGFPGIVSYRQDNYVYEYREKEKTYMLDKKAAYLVVLYKSDRLKLYGYVDGRPMKSYYIEKDHTLYMASPDNWMDTILKLFGDNKQLISLIGEGVYDYDHTYLVVKYYDSMETK